MPETNSNEPPELPPPLPGSPETMLTVTGDEENEAEQSEPLPPPAPLFLRMIAYLLDWTLASAGLLLLLCWLIPSEYPEGIPALKQWLGEVWGAYAAQLNSGRLLTVEETGAWGEKIMKLATNPPEAATDLLFFVSTVQIFFFFAFFMVTEFFTGGASLGKKICNLRVASISDYGPPRFFDTFWRSAWKSLFYCSPSALLLFIGVIDAHIPLLNARRRSLHDMFSRTEVIDARYAPLSPEDEYED